MPILSGGTPAPGFTLAVTPDQNLSLSDLAGRPVILAFYPADWSPVCGDQMALYNEVLPEFKKHGAELLGISVDGAWCHEEPLPGRRRWKIAAQLPRATRCRETARSDGPAGRSCCPAGAADDRPPFQLCLSDPRRPWCMPPDINAV